MGHVQAAVAGVVIEKVVEVVVEAVVEVFQMLMCVTSFAEWRKYGKKGKRKQ